MANNDTAQTLHVFEKAGLGKAPFRCVGMERKVGPITLRDGLTVGAPGQPMGTCDFCGTGIADCFQIVSADGRSFVVGCDCVAKTSDSGLRKVVDAKVRELRRERDRMRRAAADQKVTVELAELLADESVKAKLAARPHPAKWAADEGKTAADYVAWMRRACGATGRKGLLSYVRKVAGE